MQAECFLSRVARQPNWPRVFLWSDTAAPNMAGTTGSSRIGNDDVMCMMSSLRNPFVGGALEQWIVLCLVVEYSMVYIVGMGGSGLYSILLQPLNDWHIDTHTHTHTHTHTSKHTHSHWTHTHTIITHTHTHSPLSVGVLPGVWMAICWWPRTSTTTVALPQELSILVADSALFTSTQHSLNGQTPLSLSHFLIVYRHFNSLRNCTFLINIKIW